MADQPAPPPVAPQSLPPKVADSDPGLQDFLRHVYNTMCLGCIITGSVGFLLSHMPSVQHVLFGFPMLIVTIFAPVAFAWFGFTPDRVMHMMAEKVSFIFALYSAVMGISMSCLFGFVSEESIARLFFIVAAAFAATSAYGLQLKREISNVESTMVMAATGVVLSLLGNFLLHATVLYYVVSIIGTLAFTGIAMWESHILKESYAAYRDEKGAKDRLAIGGALVFYLTFIGLFQYLLNFGWAQGSHRR